MSQNEHALVSDIETKHNARSYFQTAISLMNSEKKLQPLLYLQLQDQTIEIMTVVDEPRVHQVVEVLDPSAPTFSTHLRT
jgi:phage major head subunit gpT-like protein